MDESQQREPRLRLVTGSGGLAIPGLGLVEVTPQAVHLALPIQCVTRGGTVHRLRESCLCPLRFLQRQAPVAPQLNDLGTMDQALPCVRHHFRLLLAPFRQSLGPRLGAAQLKYVLAVGDDAAVHQARHDRGELAGRDGDHHFIHESQALLDAAQPNQRMSTLVRSKGEEIRIAVTFGNALRFLRNIRHALPVLFARTL